MAKIHGLVKKLNKLYFLTPYDNMDDILDKLRDSDCSDLDDDIELGDESDTDSDWEYESEDERVLCGGGVGDADRGGVVGDADVVGADAGGGVGDADCGAGSSIVRVEDSVCRDSGNECDGLVGGNDVDQSDNDHVYRGGDGDCLHGDDGGLDCLRGGVRVRYGVRGPGARFCGVGGNGKRSGRGRHGVCVHGCIHGPGRGLGVRDHGVADLQWEPVDIADEELLDDTFSLNETKGLKVQMNQQQNVLDFLQPYLTDKMLELIVIEKIDLPTSSFWKILIRQQTPTLRTGQI